MLRYFITIIIIVFLFSCTEEITLDISNPTPRKLVVNCLFKSGEVFKVKISSDVAINDTLYPPLENALVIISDNFKNTDTLLYSNNGFYYSKIIPKENTTYRLKAYLTGYQAVTATDSIPTISEVIGNQTITGKYFNEYGDQLRESTITFKDNAQQNNYYEIIFLPGNLYHYNYHLINDPVILNYCDWEYEPQSFVFTDNFFNGNIYTFTVKYEGGEPSITTIKYNFVWFRNISDNYLKFKKSLYRHLYNQNKDQNIRNPENLLLVGEPVELFSNIENGYGIFAGYTEQRIQLHFKP